MFSLHSIPTFDIHHQAIAMTCGKINSLPGFPIFKKSYSCTKAQFSKFAFPATCFMLLTLIYLGCMLHYVCYPFIAESKGLTSTQVGLIIGTFPFVNIFSFPISFVLVSKMNLKLTFAVSAFVQFIVFALFGLVPSMPKLPFEIYSFLFPIILSFQVSLFDNCAYSMLQILFPQNGTLILTVRYIFTSSPYLMGPPIGGILYNWIGFLPMFLLFSLVGLIVTTLAVLLLHHSHINTRICSSEKEDPSPWLIFQVLFTPSISLNLFFIFIASSLYSYFLPVIGPYLASRYNIGIFTIGTILVVSEVSNLIVALPLGYIMNKWSCFHYSIIGSGYIIHAIGIFLYVPSSIVFPTTGNYLPLSFVANLLTGIGYAVSYIPTMSLTLKIGQSKFPTCRTSTNTIINGLITAVYCFGESAGPVAAGIIAELWVLDVVTLYLSVIISIAAILVFIIMLVTGELKQIIASFLGRILQLRSLCKRSLNNLLYSCIYSRTC